MGERLWPQTCPISHYSELWPRYTRCIEAKKAGWPHILLRHISVQYWSCSGIEMWVESEPVAPCRGLFVIVGAGVDADIDEMNGGGVIVGRSEGSAGLAAGAVGGGDAGEVLDEVIFFRGDHWSPPHRANKAGAYKAYAPALNYCDDSTPRLVRVRHR